MEAVSKEVCSLMMNELERAPKKQGDCVRTASPHWCFSVCAI